MSTPSVLVGTLYAGENEYKQCVNALRRQTFTQWKQETIRDLPSQAAHRLLYESFMAHRSEHEVFMKLDADMVLEGQQVLGDIVRRFAADPNLDHLRIDVYDWASQSSIPAMHAFSKRAVWRLDDERMFVDPDPAVPGKVITIQAPRPPLVYHSPDPSPFQAFRYGVHRASKAIQVGRRDFSVGRARSQWQLLSRVWNHFRQNPDIRLGLVVLGADLVLRGRIDHAAYADPRDGKLRAAYEKSGAGCWTVEALYAHLSSRWGNWARREVHHKKWVALPYLKAAARSSIKRVRLSYQRAR